MDDIVKELREGEQYCYEPGWGGPMGTMSRAADEIERLREALAAIERVASGEPLSSVAPRHKVVARWYRTMLRHCRDRAADALL